MDLELRNLKGTKDFMPEEQQIRNRIRRTLEEVFEKYGCKPLETPAICYFDILASKYAGGAEILKEIYKLTDQGGREVALRYDLTVPFAKVIGMNPTMRMPFKRYEIGKVFRDGPVKTGRMREFIQCDVDVVGIKSVMAEAELMAMAFEAFKKLNLDVYISYNNRKLLSGLLYSINVPEEYINEVILSLDKIEKIDEEGVREELRTKGMEDVIINEIFKVFNNEKSSTLEYFKNNFDTELIREGLEEMEALNGYLKAMGLFEKVRFNPCLARGLDIYTGTVYEIFLTDGTITSSIGGGGRYDKIIGAFLQSEDEYPSVGISFGLDVIFTALTLRGEEKYKSLTDLYIIPLGTEGESMSIAQRLRAQGVKVELEMWGRKFKKAMDYANKEGIPYLLVLGENEVQSGCCKIKSMNTGEQFDVMLKDIESEFRIIKDGRPETELNAFCSIH